MRQPFASKLPKKPRSKKKEQSVINKALLVRLKILGFILLVFAFLFFSYALTNPPVDEPVYSFSQVEEVGAGFLDIETFEDASAKDTLNFYAISGVFFTLGVTCVLTSLRQGMKRKKK